MFSEKYLRKAGIRSYNRRKSSGAAFHIVMYILVLAAAVVIFGYRGSCASSDQAIRAVENLGFTDIEVVDKAIWFIGFRGCDSKDAALFTVRGKNPAGKVVEVGVCVGWPFKGATVRSQ
jgi:hypothetical protein